MDSQTRIGAAVIGVLLILFLAILYSRFSGEGAAVDLNIHSPEAIPVHMQPQQPEPRLVQPTIVKEGGSADLPPEAFIPQIATPPPAPPIGPKPGGLMMTPAEFEARRIQQWPLPSPLDRVLQPQD